MEIEAKPAPWLKSDRVWKWVFQSFQIRIERWGKRVAILPYLEFNWEQGGVTVAISWILYYVAVDYLFDQWDPSEEIEYPA